MITTDEVLPETTARVLDAFVGATREAFATRLVSIVLYGSAAEGRLRPSSDVNVLVLSSAWDAAAADALREPLRTAYAAIRLHAMFVLDSELEAAASAFADKFADITRRHRILFGSDPFVTLVLPRREQVLRLRQVLLNAVLRLREGYVRVSLRDEQAALLVAEHAGSLRVAAAELLALSGTPAASPKAALQAALDGMPRFAELPAAISAAREHRLEPGRGASTLLALIDLTEQLRARALALPESAP